MRRECVEKLIPQMPDDAPYLNDFPTHRNPGPEARRMADVDKFCRCTADPEFGWHFVRSFVDTGRPFPPNIEVPTLIRTYQWISKDPIYYMDGDVTGAMALNHAEYRWARRTVRAHLLIADYPLRDICKEVSLSMAALRIYMDLFFNVRDRLDETAYIQSIIYPEGRKILFDRHYMENESSDSLLMRMAQEHGANAVKYIAGYKSQYLSGFDPNRAGKQFETGMLTWANLWIAMGGANTHAPVIQNAKALVSSRNVSGMDDGKLDDELSLGRMSVDCSILEHVKRAEAPDPRLIAEAGEVMAKAIEKVNKNHK